MLFSSIGGAEIRTKRSKNDESRNCVPGTNWKEDCNSCFCTPNGVGACTEMACFNEYSLQSHRRRRSISDSSRLQNEYDNSAPRIHRPKTKIETPIAPRANCEPGTRWKQDCNSCWCSEDGFAACTLMACLSFNNNLHAVSNRHNKQTMFKSTGSPNSIPEEVDQHNRIRRSENTSPKCTPGTRWKEDCNNCWCSDNGFAACTLMACLHFNDNIHAIADRHNKQTLLKPAGSPNSEDVEQHNRVRRSENTSSKCTPGTRWKQDCNDCWCTETGVGVCTLMGCLHFDNNIKPHTSDRRRRSSSDTLVPTRFHTSQPENEKKCTPGTTWMNNCNRCRCIAGRAGCTRMMCLGQRIYT